MPEENETVTQRRPMHLFAWQSYNDSDDSTIIRFLLAPDLESAQGISGLFYKGAKESWSDLGILHFDCNTPQWITSAGVLGDLIQFL